MAPPLDWRAGHQLLAQHAHHFQPGVVHLDELADRRRVAQQVHLGAFAQHADGGAGGIVRLVEETGLRPGAGCGSRHRTGARRIVRACRAPAWEARARDAWCGARRAVSSASMFACRMRTSRSESPGEDGGAAGTPRWLAAGPRIDQHIAHAQLLDEAQRLLAGAGADGQHADHRADAEHDAQRRQQRSRLLGAQIGERLGQISEKMRPMPIHCGSAFMALPLPTGRRSGSAGRDWTCATTSPSAGR